MNSYNLYEEAHYDTILYHAVASDENEVKALAAEKGYDIEGLTIELDRKNVKNELGRPYKPFIQDAIVH